LQKQGEVRRKTAATGKRENVSEGQLCKEILENAEKCSRIGFVQRAQIAEKRGARGKKVKSRRSLQK
jgi:hypothetical protein